MARRVAEFDVPSGTTVDAAEPTGPIPARSESQAPAGGLTGGTASVIPASRNSQK